MLLLMSGELSLVDLCRSRDTNLSAPAQTSQIQLSNAGLIEPFWHTSSLATVLRRLQNTEEPDRSRLASAVAALKELSDVIETRQQITRRSPSAPWTIRSTGASQLSLLLLCHC